MDLEKLITTNPIWDFFTETFDLLWAMPFENLVFRPQSQGGQICVSWISRRRRRRRRRTNSQIQIQASPKAPRDEILPQGKPSLLTKYSCTFYKCMRPKASTTFLFLGNMEKAVGTCLGYCFPANMFSWMCSANGLFATASFFGSVGSKSHLPAEPMMMIDGCLRTQIMAGNNKFMGG